MGYNSQCRERIVTNMNNFYSAISELEPGEEIAFNVKRTSDTSDMELELQVIVEAKTIE